MGSALYVGDVHATVDGIEDCRRLIQFVKKVADARRPDRIVFLGDQYHNHGIMHVEVMAFWKWAFNHLRGHPLVALRGNHDAPGDEASTSHALMAHLGEVDFIVDKPMVIDGILHLPYYHSADEFVAVCKASGEKAVVCHQSFNGGRYDNGIYMEGGVEPNLIPQELVISGHVHTPQEFSKVWYMGAPRWRTLSDANVDRSVWYVEHNDDGTIASKEAFDTGDACQRIVSGIETPEDILDVPSNPNWRYMIDIKGPVDFVNERKAYWKKTLPGVRVRTFPQTKKVKKAVRESEGLEKSFGAYMKVYTPPNGTSKDVLHKLVKERLGVAIPVEAAAAA